MNVKKIFITLITIVACVILGAFVLNVLMPNVTSALINSTEAMIHRATGLTFDFNHDGTTGANDSKVQTDGQDDVTVNSKNKTNNVNGWADGATP